MGGKRVERGIGGPIGKNGVTTVGIIHFSRYAIAYSNIRRIGVNVLQAYLRLDTSNTPVDGIYELE